VELVGHVGHRGLTGSKQASKLSSLEDTTAISSVPTPSKFRESQEPSDDPHPSAILDFCWRVFYSACGPRGCRTPECGSGSGTRRKAIGLPTRHIRGAEATTSLRASLTWTPARPQREVCATAIACGCSSRPEEGGLGTRCTRPCPRRRHSAEHPSCPRFS
jgi:hypothetical protein